MVRMVFAIVVAAAVGLFVAGGCDKKEPAEEASAAAVKSEVEIEVEAEEAITEENLDEQLDLLEKEIAADSQ
jgi:hypothetical protein